MNKNIACGDAFNLHESLALKTLLVGMNCICLHGIIVIKINCKTMIMTVIRLKKKQTV